MSIKKDISIRNKKATFDYELVDKYIAGIQLTGSEIKSIRNSKASLVDSFGYADRGELWVKGIHISEYSFSSYNNHTPKRDRKLLLKKKEIVKIEDKLKEVGTTVVVTRMFINDRGWAKVEIAVARGKKKFDKREDIKSKDAKRSIDRAMKRF